MTDSTHVTTTHKVSVDGESESRQINQYQLQHKLGEGAFGVVYLALDGRGETFAMKEINKRKIQRKTSGFGAPGRLAPGGAARPGGLRIPPGAGKPAVVSEDPWDMIKREIAIMKKLKHKHVIMLKEVLDDDESESLFMVMESASNGPILDLNLNGDVPPLSIERAWKIFRELILGVEYLHFQNIAHRDLKPDNVLLDEHDCVKIVDFGVSEMFQGGKDSVRKSAGSPAFMSPEMCTAKGASETFSAFKADIWSMGVVLFCLVAGRVPYRGETVFMTYEMIRTEEPPYPEGLPEDLRDLFSQLLQKNPDDRISMSDLKLHRWVTKNSAFPLAESSENCGVRVSVTDEEAKNSITQIKSVSGLATVVRAIGRFRRASQGGSGSQ